MNPRTFGVLQVLLGVLLSLAALASPWPGPLLIWPAFAVLLVGLGYLFWGPAVFGKRPDGTMRTLHRIALFPYHVIAYLRLRWDRLRSRDAAWHEVSSNIFVGGVVGPAMLPPGTSVIVDLTSEFAAPIALRTGRQYFCLPTLDTRAPDYDAALALARQLAQHPGPIYVHCAAGRGRSATFAAALLFARGLAKDVQSAEEMLRARRKVIKFQPEQRAMLERMAEELRQAEGSSHV